MRVFVAQKKPKPPTPGIQLIEKPNSDSKNYRTPKENTIVAKRIIHKVFHGVMTQISNGIAQQQLTHGINQQTISRGHPVGQAKQKMFNGNIINMPSTFGVTWSFNIGWH